MADGAAAEADISQLTASQQEALQQYTDVTGQEVNEAISVLGRSQWNVQVCEPARNYVERSSNALPTRLLSPSSSMARDKTLSPRRYRHKTAHRQPPAHGSTHSYPTGLEGQHLATSWRRTTACGTLTTLGRGEYREHP